MNELVFDITSQHLGNIIRNNNQTRHEHFPKEIYKNQLINKVKLILFTKK